MMSSMTASMGGGGSSEGSSGGGQQMTTEEYENTKPDELKKDIRMISGCHDKQTSADVSNVSSFQLPDPAGEFISVLWAVDVYLYCNTYFSDYCLFDCVVEVFLLQYIISCALACIEYTISYLNYCQYFTCIIC